MAFRFFTIPIAAPDAAAEEMYAFLRSHRILKADRQWVEQGTASLWTFCVEYLDGAAANPEGRIANARGKVDYKELLSPRDFTIFANLRDLRRTISQRDACPVYAVFTNER